VPYSVLIVGALCPPSVWYGLAGLPGEKSAARRVPKNQLAALSPAFARKWAKKSRFRRLLADREQVKIGAFLREAPPQWGDFVDSRLRFAFDSLEARRSRAARPRAGMARKRARMPEERFSRRRLG
jgi:hypothetical protein